MNFIRDFIAYWLVVGVLIAPSSLRKNKNKANNWWNLANVDLSSSPVDEVQLPPHGLPLTKKQQKLVNKNPGSMGVLIKAAKLAVDECTRQFGGRRWNCPVSTTYHGGNVFGAIVKKGRYPFDQLEERNEPFRPPFTNLQLFAPFSSGCRETAFLHALTSAALTYSVARACSEGSIQTCSCGSRFPRRLVTELSKKQNCGSPPLSSVHAKENKKTKKRQKSGEEKKKKKPKVSVERNFQEKDDDQPSTLNQIPHPDQDVECQWGGCSDNNEFGLEFSREFIDGSERDKDLRCAVNLHNNEAGRQHVNRLLQMDCKCHGMSGSCSIKTCWMKISSFSQVAGTIMERYNGACKVDQGNDIRGRMRFNVKPSKLELVYFEDSPRFCEPDSTLNFSGVRGRVCNASSHEDDGCEQMCCGRGFRTEKFQVHEKCNCTFHWCCDVKCDRCQVTRERHMCL